MQINRNVVTLAAVAGVAFLAGSLDFFSGSTAVATAALRQDGAESEMMAEMDAMIAAGTPGEHHKHLEQFIGQWDGIVRIRQEPGMPMMEMSASVTREWILDGHFVRETVTSESEWGVFKGFGFMGYNNLEGRYQMIWMDTTATAITMETGTYDPAAKILRSRGTQRDPVTGRLIATRGETDSSSPDRHVYRGYQTGANGVEFMHFEGEFTRVK